MNRVTKHTRTLLDLDSENSTKVCQVTILEELYNSASKPLYLEKPARKSLFNTIIDFLGKPWL